MQVKLATKALLALVADLARRVTFAERRQQRQNPSLAETFRENSQNWEGGYCFFLYGLLEQVHSCLMSNAIFGFLCCPLHALLCCFSCVYWKYQNQGQSQQEIIDAQEAELATLRAELQQQVMA